MLKAKFGKDYIRKELARQRQAIVSDMVRIVAREGEKFLSDARSSLNIDTSAFPTQRTITQRDIDRGRTAAPVKGDYLDDSGNLRSSIGYAVLVDGDVVVSKIPNSVEGISAFTNILDSLPWARGITFVGMAGMDYASYLEAMGYNVISSQWDVVLVDLSAALKKYETISNRKLLKAEINIIDKLQ